MRIVARLIGDGQFRSEQTLAMLRAGSKSTIENAGRQQSSLDRICRFSRVNHAFYGVQKKREMRMTRHGSFFGLRRHGILAAKFDPRADTASESGISLFEKVVGTI